MPNYQHHVEVDLPYTTGAEVALKLLGESAVGHSSGRLQIIANSQTSLANAKSAVDAIGTAIKNAAV